MPVIKDDGCVGIRWDYKVTINKVVKRDQFPISRINNLFASFSSGNKFMIMDLHVTCGSNEYQEVPLDGASHLLVTVNTHKALFKYNCFPFSVCSTSLIFQRIMEILLQNIPVSAQPHYCSLFSLCAATKALEM